MPKKYNMSAGGEQKGKRIKRSSSALSQDGEPVELKTVQADSDKKKEEESPKKKETVSLPGLYRYSSTGDRVGLVFGMIFTLIGGVGNPILMWYSSDVLSEFYNLNITSNTSETERYDSIIDIAKRAAVFIVVVDVCVFVFLFAGMTLWLRSSDKIVQRVRRLAFNNLVRQHMGFFDLNEPGTIITCMAEDTIKYQSGMGEKVATSITWFSQMVSTIVVAFVGDWLLAIIAYCMLPIPLLVTGLGTKSVRKLATQQFKAYGKAGVVAEESISAIKVVQAFGGENKQSKRYDTQLTDARKLGQKAGLFIAMSNSTSLFMAMLVFSVLFWVGGVRYLQGKLTQPGVLIQVTLAATISMRTFGFMVGNNEFITSARAAAYSIYKYIECKSEIDSLDSAGEKPSEVSGDISFENVHFEYPSRPDVPVLKGLTLNIPRGKNVALVGPSGCGKSTTIQLIQRYYDPRQGEVKLDGKNVKKLNTKWMRNQIGVVAQEPTLFATTIEENIRFGRPGATTADVVECAKEADAHNFIMQLPDQYDTVLNEAATLLSRGQKQRISLARALVRKPTVLLLDECTSALDTESEIVVQQALEKAARGRTTITIAHRLSTVRNSDTLYVINEGVLWEQGNHEELMAHGGLYRDLVANQMKGMEEEKGDFDDSDEDDDKPLGVLNRSPSLVSTRSARETLAELQRIADEEIAEEEEKPKAPIRRIFSYNKPETCIMIIGSISSLLFGFGIPAIAILVGELFVMFRLEDPQEQRDIVFLYCPIMMGVAIAVGVSTFGAFATLKYAGEWLTQRLRSEVFLHILKMEIGWFDRKENQVGALTSQLANDASRVQAATGTVLVTLFSAVATLLGAAVVGIVYGWKLGLPILAYTPFSMSVAIIQSFVNTKFSQWTAKASRDGGKIVAEVIDKIQVVASLTKEDFFEDRFNSFFDQLAIKERNKALTGGAAWGMTYFFLGGSFLLSFPYGMYLVAQGDIQPENIIRILYGVSAATQELARMNVYATEFVKAKTAAAGLFKLLDRKSEIDPHDSSGIKPSQSNGELQVKKCYFNYPTRRDLIALKNFSMEVKRGQFIAIVGPSGSGKTTAITLFERFYDTLRGDVSLDGVPLKNLNLDWVRSQMSIVTQDPILFNIGLNENIAFGDNTREVSQQEIIEAAKSANIHNFIATLPNGYNTPAGTKGTQLSGGQKQRVSIARALIRNPKILLLDDAMSALDAESEKQVEVALENAREGRTTIMVSHRLSSILKADMIYVVDDGKVVEKGTHTTLMERRSHYFKLQQASLGLSE